MNSLRVLLLEDSELDAELTIAQLKSCGLLCIVTRVETEKQFREALAAPVFDLILADYVLPDFDGQSALELVRASGLEIPFIFVSGVLGEEVAIDSLQQGATDYILKHRIDRLCPAVRRSLAEQEQRRERQRLETERAELLVSEQKARAEAEARAAELTEVNAALAHSNAELERFAYAASHDLQEPLRMVKAFTQMLSRHLEGQVDSKAKEMMEFIVVGSDRMQRLVDDLLSYSRVLHDREQSRDVIDLNVVLDEALICFKTMIEETGATVTREILPLVKADSERLGMVFQNLLSNSLKYRDEKIPNIHVGSLHHEGEWIISVQDNGIGFDPQYADRVFGLFKRLHRTNHYPGTGVGLALCKQIIEQHGGRIWAESQLGEGSTFRFSLPDT